MNERTENFDEAYREGTPPWETGRPQPVFAALAESGEVTGNVLDVGCGTGENALLFAEYGCTVVGIDGSVTAIERARAKGAERGVGAEFRVWDALRLTELGRTYDAVLDCGLFHVFTDEERLAYVAGLAAVLRPGGRYFMLVFSDAEPGDWGPRRVGRAEIERAFGEGWQILRMERETFENSHNPNGSAAWFAVVAREVEEGGNART